MKEKKDKTVIEKLNDLNKLHHYILNAYVKALNGNHEHDGLPESYWRGALVGTETILDELGVEYEEFNPFDFISR